MSLKQGLYGGQDGCLEGQGWVSIKVRAGLWRSGISGYSLLRSVYVSMMVRTL